ncbi:hypothetical protein ACNTMW_25050 [Planosporangium sp. 12N6]|uniref:hypothetical protein n=1 Tax=Planosporangium spinosum TaxID=3402278 RepID=UPI003CF600C7
MVGFAHVHTRVTRRRLAVLSLLAVVATGVSVPTATRSAAASAPLLTREQISELPVDAQNAILNPLRVAASSLDAVGRNAMADIYAGVGLDPVHRTVDLYLTKPDRSAEFVRTAAGQRPFDTAVVRVHPATYTRAALHAARDRVIAQAPQSNISVSSAAVPPDGSGLDVGVAPKPAAGVMTAAADPASQLSSIARVAVTVKTEPVATSQSRYADFAPYYSGGYITTSVGAACTTGLTTHNSNTTYLFTAAHCARTGVNIYNGNGNFEGQVINWSEQWDAALIDARSDQYEFDSGPSAYDPRRVAGNAYSYYNDSVCQDGYTSGIICGITVIIPDIVVNHCGGPYPCMSSRGVVGQTGNNTGTAVRSGDSGGLVFCVCSGSSGPRQARGMVSSNYQVNSRVFWTEAPDILSAFGQSMY